MKLISQDIIHGEKIASKFTCDGEDISPHLRWEDVPKNTKGFAISCIDQDSKAGTWIHWYVVNIPQNVREIKQGSPIPGKELENDFGNEEYGGPCPEKGKHRYFFTIYALDTDKIDGINKSNFDDMISKHLLESTEIMGRYKRKN